MRPAVVPVNIFPPRGGPKKRAKNMVAFRPTPEQAAYLKKALERGYGATEVIHKMMDWFIAIEAELGESSGDLEAVAKMIGVSPGAAIGRMVKDGLPQLREQLLKAKK